MANADQLIIIRDINGTDTKNLSSPVADVQIESIPIKFAFAASSEISLSFVSRFMSVYHTATESSACLPVCHLL